MMQLLLPFQKILSNPGMTEPPLVRILHLETVIFGGGGSRSNCPSLLSGSSWTSESENDCEEPRLAKK